MPTGKKSWLGGRFSNVTLGTVVYQSTQRILGSFKLTSCCNLPSRLVPFGIFNLCSSFMLRNGRRWEKWTSLGNVVNGQSPQSLVKTCLNVRRSAQLLKGSYVSLNMCIARPIVRRTWTQNPAKSRGRIGQFLSCIRTEHSVSTSAKRVSCKVLQRFIVGILIPAALWICNANPGVPIPDNECTNLASHSSGFNGWKDVVCLNDATKFLGLLIRHVTFLWIRTKPVSVPLQHSSRTTVLTKRILAIMKRHVFQCLHFLLQPFISRFSYSVILIVCKSVSIFDLSCKSQWVNGFKNRRFWFWLFLCFILPMWLRFCLNFIQRHCRDMMHNQVWIKGVHKVFCHQCCVKPGPLGVLTFKHCTLKILGMLTPETRKQPRSSPTRRCNPPPLEKWNSWVVTKTDLTTFKVNQMHVDVSNQGTQLLQTPTWAKPRPLEDNSASTLGNGLGKSTKTSQHLLEPFSFCLKLPWKVFSMSVNVHVCPLSPWTTRQTTKKIYPRLWVNDVKKCLPCLRIISIQILFCTSDHMDTMLMSNLSNGWVLTRAKLNQHAMSWKIIATWLRVCYLYGHVLETYMLLLNGSAWQC